MKNGTIQPMRLGALLAIGLLIHSQAEATLSFYAPYDTNFALSVGTNPQPSTTNASPGITTGYALNGISLGNALDVPGKTNGLQYKRVDSYFAGVGNNVTIGSNTFRLLYKPDYSGVQGPFELRKFIFGAGALGTGDSFALYHADGPAHGPAAIFSIGGVVYPMYGLSNLNWNSSIWYDMGVSFDKTGAMFYFRAMTNGALPIIQTISFGSTTWGPSGFLDAIPLYVGVRPNTLNEGAEGNIDDIKVFKNETWSADNFNYDYAVIIPEPTSGLLIVAAVTLACFRKRNG